MFVPLLSPAAVVVVAGDCRRDGRAIHGARGGERSCGYGSVLVVVQLVDGVLVGVDPTVKLASLFLAGEGLERLGDHLVSTWG